MEKYYNGLNVLFEGNYSKLKKSWERFGNWETAFLKEKSRLNPEKEWQKLEKLEIRLVLNSSPEYPESLKEMPFSPFGLYILGDLSYSQPATAIVGTRSASQAGKELSKYFAEKLGNAGITIVSGLALGIDEAAHKGALESGAKTIAVLGTPLNHIYPKQNERLAYSILEKGGAIVSEFPLNQEYHPQNFLARNRIISGLSKAVLIIEAPERSGALATAKFAIEQNREIFVIPGNITAKNYKGSNSLIKAGAAPATSPDDILEYFGISPKIRKENSANPANKSENEIVRALRKEKLTVEQLSRDTGLALSDLNKNLAMLIIKGIIKESNGKYYL